MGHHLRFRQVHLDFHTSPHIPGIGKGFNKELWQKNLRDGHVDSITCFAVCHHGLAYYETSLGNKHPNLECNLLQEQFDACKEIDINVPIYITAGVNNWVSDKHPEWREITCDGQYAGWSVNPLQPGFHKMCFNTPFLDFLCEQIKEVVGLYPTCDGIFLDIIHQGECCCNWCMKSMLEKGLNPEKAEDRAVHAKEVLEKYYRKTTDAAKTNNPEMPIFHNSGHITKGDTGILKYFSHLELESLPTGGWGYDHFPLSAKYCLNLDKDFLGMTGKFHTTWGEFGGYKHPNALRYECAAMIAMGAKCSIGDQLHPSGEIDESTYNLIGSAYKEVEEKEAWCDNVTNIADIGLLSTVSVNQSSERESSGDTGAGRILLESHILFDIIDSTMDFEKYKILLLPDDLKVDDELKTKIDAYLSQGGKLILSGDSGVNSDGDEFIWDTGAKFCGKSKFQPDYIKPESEFQPSFCTSPIVMYLPSNAIEVTDGESLGKVFDPYFNRTFEHFCSHQHTPYKLTDSGHDCGVINKNILYFAHPVFSIYRWYGAVVYKEYIVNAIRKFMKDQLTVKTNMPSTARLTLMEQPEQQRYVLHLLYANKITRGGSIEMSGGNVRDTGAIEVIEELEPLHDTEISVFVDKKIEKVSLQPQGEEIPFTPIDNGIKIKIDSFTCHQMVEIDYTI